MNIFFFVFLASTKIVFIATYLQQRYFREARACTYPRDSEDIMWTISYLCRGAQSKIVCIGLKKVETHFFLFKSLHCSYDASKALKSWITAINCAINHAIDFDICFENSFKWFRKSLYFSIRAMKLLNF